MLFFKTHKGQVTLNFLFSFFAALVIFAAMMKILHWQGADIAIMVGLIAEAIVFLVMAFLVPPPEEPHWQRYFPDINTHPDLDPNFKPTPLSLGSTSNGNPALNKLEEDGLITQSRNAKSLFLTAQGVAAAKQLESILAATSIK
jgi:gliding motility-associated protein GldL